VQSYQIAILANNKYFGDEEFFHVFEYYDIEHKVSLGGKSKIITVELAKLKSIADKPIDCMKASERWATYFEYLTDKDKRDKVNEILKYEEGIAMASEVLMQISKDEIEQFRLMEELKNRLDLQSEFAYARKTGLAEGRAEGRAEGHQKILETARKMKVRGRLSIEEIAEDTGISVDEIIKL